MNATELRDATITAVCAWADQKSIYRGTEGSQWNAVEAAIEAEIDAARPQWQPIETAPRGEGEWILACNAGAKFLAVTGYDEDDDCWFTLNQTFRDWHPTHWMPLISPPDLLSEPPR